jgi:small neutral amino acid transporter SnatA (MarC family)
METTVAAIVTMYMVMLGPVKLILPFAHATANADAALKRKIAIRTTLWGCAVALICVLLGGNFVTKFLVSGGGTGHRTVIFPHDICHQHRNCR